MLQILHSDDVKPDMFKTSKQVICVDLADAIDNLKYLVAGSPYLDFSDNEGWWLSNNQTPYPDLPKADEYFYYANNQKVFIKHPSQAKDSIHTLDGKQCVDYRNVRKLKAKRNVSYQIRRLIKLIIEAELEAWLNYDYNTGRALVEENKLTSLEDVYIVPFLLPDYQTEEFIKDLPIELCNLAVDLHNCFDELLCDPIRYLARSNPDALFNLELRGTLAVVVVGEDYRIREYYRLLQQVADLEAKLLQE